MSLSNHVVFALEDPSDFLPSWWQKNALEHPMDSFLFSFSFLIFYFPPRHLIRNGNQDPFLLIRNSSRPRKNKVFLYVFSLCSNSPIRMLCLELFPINAVPI